MAKLTPIKFSQLELTPEVDGSEIIPIVKGGENAAVLVSVLLANKVSVSDLATVAFTGSYNDLIDKPVIPEVPVLSVNGRVGNVVGLAEAADLQAFQTTVQQELDTKVDIPSPLIPKILIGTTLESSNLGDVGYDDAPSPMTMAFRGFEGTLKANDPQEDDDLVTKQWADTQLATKESLSNKGIANGYAPLDADAKVPAIHLPSYVDDVQDYASVSAFPPTGSAGVIYVANDTNKTYRWSGSSYIEISPSPGTTDSLAEGSTNLYFTQARARASISGTPNQVLYNSATGVLSLPQNINTGAAPTFASLTLTNTVNALTVGGTSNLASVVMTTSVPIPLTITSTRTSGPGAGGGMTVVVDDGQPMASADRLGYMLWGGLYDPAIAAYNAVGIVAYASEDWNTTNHGAYLAIEYTAAGAAGRRAGVRIGDPTAGAAMFISGETTTSAAHALRVVASNNANLFNVRNDGKVALNTLEPSGLLHLKALVETDTPLLGASSGNNSNAVINIAAGDNIVRWGIRLGVGSANMLHLDYRDSSTGAANALLSMTREGLIGIRTTPTHTLTFGSSSTGMVYYNTASQAINYERLRMVWNSNVFNITTEASGTGVSRSILLSAFGLGSPSSLRINNSSLPGFVQVSGTSSTAGAIIQAVNGTLSSTSGQQHALSINTTVAQTSLAGYTGIFVNITEESLGSGAKRLLELQTNGITRFAIDNTGKFTTALAQTYSVANAIVDRTYNADATTLDELADVLATLISDLRAQGLVL